MKLAKYGLPLITAFVFTMGLSATGCNKALAIQQDPREPLRFETAQRLSLSSCVEIALKNNRMRTVSKASREIAEAQYRQALSAYWPQLSLTSTGTRMDQPPLFVFPSGPLPLGDAAGALAQSVAVSNLMANGLTPFDLTGNPNPLWNPSLQGATQQVAQNLQSAKIPAQKVKLMNRDSLVTSLEMIYPLYTGGKRLSIVTQARLGTDVAREASRHTDLRIVHDVKNIYYANVLARNLLKLGEDTLERFEVTLELTENLYKNGSGKVKKTDYLRTQVVVASIRSFVELLKSNEKLTRSALVTAMGIDWRSEIEPADTDIPFQSYGGDIERLVADAHRHNPQMIQIGLGIDATAAKKTEAASGHLPILVFFGNLNRIDNSYDAGIVPSQNKNNWALGLRMELPIFKGFRIVNEEREADARVSKLREERMLLKEGLAFQVKDAFLQIARSQGQVKATKEALSAAIENRDLNIRAYSDELVETKDVIEAQMIEFFINGQYLKAAYDSAASQADLEFLVGKGIGGM